VDGTRSSMDLITESVTENGETKVVAQWTHEHISDLVEKIIAIPPSHDEREIVIADLVKRHIHQEKSGVYNNLKHLTKHLDCHKTTEYLEMKEKTHQKLEREWEYGTKYSCATDIMRPLFAEMLKELLDEKSGGTYCAASLCLGDYVFNSTKVRKYLGKHGGEDRHGSEWEYRPYEKYLWCKLYLKHKTPTHHFYEGSLKYVTAVESKAGLKTNEYTTFRVSA
jgi:hypothetical protein